MQKFNDWLGERLAIFLSSMGCFYIIVMMVVVPLFKDHPHDLIGWINYIVQTFFQGAALPVLGYVAKIAGEKQEKLTNETHDAVIEELLIVKEELSLAKEEREMIKTLLHQKEKL